MDYLDLLRTIGCVLRVILEVTVAVLAYEFLLEFSFLLFFIIVLDDYLVLVEELVISFLIMLFKALTILPMVFPSLD